MLPRVFDINCRYLKSPILLLYCKAMWLGKAIFCIYIIFDIFKDIIDHLYYYKAVTWYLRVIKIFICLYLCHKCEYIIAF